MKIIEKIIVGVALLAAIGLIISGIARINNQREYSGQNGLDYELSDNGIESISPDSSISEIEKSLTLPFYTRSEDDFNITTTYYVAINEPGASNSDCDGLAPTNEGSGHCPFKDFSSPDVRGKLSNVSGVKMYVREGYYFIEKMGEGNETGISLLGDGDEFTPVILSGYPGETAVLDAGETLARADKLIAEKGPLTQADINIRQLISMSGRYNIVENLTIKDGWRHNVLVVGTHNIIRNNILIGALEDSIKVLETAHYGSIFENDISGFASQGVDYFGADNWIIKNNNIHNPRVDPITRENVGNAVGGKGGFKNLLIIGNNIHDFPQTNPQVPAISMGGTGTIELFEKDILGRFKHSATNMVAVFNTISNYKGAAVGYQYCDSCTFANNNIYNTLGGFYIGLLPEQDKDFSEFPNTRNATIKNNTIVGNHLDLSICGDIENVSVGNTCYAHFIANMDSIEGLTSEGNIYYTDTEPRFVVIDGKAELLNHAEFQARMGIDSSSKVLPIGEFILE